MLRRSIIACLVFAISFLIIPIAEAASDKGNNVIGLHDRVLKFEQEEFQEIEGKLFVPFDKLMTYLYADIVYGGYDLRKQK